MQHRATRSDSHGYVAWENREWKKNPFHSIAHRPNGMAALCTALLPELISYCYKSIESWTVRFDGLIVRRIKFSASWIQFIMCVFLSLLVTHSTCLFRLQSLFVCLFAVKWSMFVFIDYLFFIDKSLDSPRSLTLFKWPCTIRSEKSIDQITKV